MKIYGVAILAGCFLLGKLMGILLGMLIQIDGDIGGVGFAMLLLLLSNTFRNKNSALAEETNSGILFWTSMYIPVIIAMSATQNVKAAITSGPIAILAGGGATIACFLLIPLISKIGRKSEN